MLWRREYLFWLLSHYEERYLPHEEGALLDGLYAPLSAPQQTRFRLYTVRREHCVSWRRAGTYCFELPLADTQENKIALFELPLVPGEIEIERYCLPTWGGFWGSLLAPLGMIPTAHWLYAHTYAPLLTRPPRFRTATRGETRDHTDSHCDETKVQIMNAYTITYWIPNRK